MMKNILLLLLSINCFGQVPTIQWQKSFGGSQQDIPQSIKQTNDGGYITAGYTLSSDQDVTNFHGGEGDFWVVKTDANGNLQWQKAYGGTNNDYAFDIEKTSDNGYIIVGYTSSNNGDITLNKGITDYWVIKINATGTIQWQKTYGGSSFDYAFSIKQTTDGGYIVLGETFSTDGEVIANHGNTDIWVLKLSATGTIQWKKTYGGTDGDYASKIHLTSDGGYIIGGNTHSNDGDVLRYHSDRDYWIVKINATGTIQWQKTLGGSGWDDLKDVQQTADGGYIAVGRSHSDNGDISNPEGGTGWIVKLSSIGTLQWEKSLGGNFYMGLESIKQKSSGEYVIAGSIFSEIYTYVIPSANYWVFNINNSGSITWEKTMGGSEIDTATSIILTSDGGFAVAGNSNSLDGDITDGNSIYDFWIVKLSAETLSTTGFHQNHISIFPNPTKELLNVNLNNNLPIDKIMIFDCTGKILAKQITNTNQINTEPLSSGMYILEVDAAGQKFQTKFIKQ